MKFLVIIPAALVLAACGAAASQPATAPATSAPAIATATTAPTPTPSLLTTWCSLTTGESQAAVMAAMGPTNGTLPSADAVPGIASAVWDVSGDVLLASFTGGVVSNLQAYAGSIGPVGASNITCGAFRT